MRWGFLPGFVKDPKGFPLIINARAETMADRRSYGAALKRRRCLVIADGFYEWRKGVSGRTRRGQAALSHPARERRANGVCRSLRDWCDPTGGEIDTACIITTSANSLAAFVHDRMPAILEPAEFVPWLDVEGVGAAKALALLKPAPDPALELVEIGPAVNHFANDDESLQRPIAAPIRAAGGGLLI